MKLRTEGLKALSLLLDGQAMAHGDHKHLKGTVKAVSENSIAVDAVEKTEAKVLVDGATTFEQADAQTALKDLKTGERVVVHAMKRRGERAATDVKSAVDAPAAPKPASQAPAAPEAAP